MKHYYYQNPDSFEQIKRKFVNAVEKHYADRVDPEFLECIKNSKNLKINTSIHETVAVKVDAHVYMKCTVVRKGHEITGFEVKENAGTISIDPKQRKCEYESTGYNDGEFEGVWKEFGKIKAVGVPGYSENKIAIYKDFTPSGKLTQSMKDDLKKEKLYSDEVVVLRKRYENTLDENSRVVSWSSNGLTLKKVYDYILTSYIYPEFDITVSFKGKIYIIPYGLKGEALEKRSGNSKKATFEVPFSDSYKVGQNEKVDKKLKISSMIIKLAVITFLVSLPFTILLFIVVPTAGVSNANGYFIQQSMVYAIFGTAYGLFVTIKSKKRKIELEETAAIIKEKIRRQEEPKIKGLSVPQFALSALINVAISIVSLITVIII